jgi:hypothetical protein
MPWFNVAVRMFVSDVDEVCVQFRRRMIAHPRAATVSAERLPRHPRV